MELVNVLEVGATRSGKTMSASSAVVGGRREGRAVFDPHKESLAMQVLIHAAGQNVLYANLSDLEHTIGFDLLVPSDAANPNVRAQENARRAEAFMAILLRRRDLDSLAATPLMEEWVLGAVTLFLWQSRRKPLTHLPFAFQPDTPEFEDLLRDCVAKDAVRQFRHLEKLSHRGLRSEVGSAQRLTKGACGSAAFAAWSRGGFDLEGFLQRRGLLVVEKGEGIGDDTMRVVMGAIVLLIIDIAKRRPKPDPPIRVWIDEANTAHLVGKPELTALAETNKNGLYWGFLAQMLNFPGGADEVLQNCLRHEWYRCPSYDLARKAATDVLSGLPPSELSRAQRLEQLTNDITSLPPGWRWVRDRAGARKEYTPLLENPWPDWPGLRETKLRETIRLIHARPEYGVPSTPPSSPSSPSSPPPPPRSPSGSSPAERWKRERSGHTGGSSGSGGGSESGS